MIRVLTPSPFQPSPQGGNLFPSSHVAVTGFQPSPPWGGNVAAYLRATSALWFQPSPQGGNGLWLRHLVPAGFQPSPQGGNLPKAYASISAVMPVVLSSKSLTVMPAGRPSKFRLMR